MRKTLKIAIALLLIGLVGVLFEPTRIWGSWFQGIGVGLSIEPYFHKSQGGIKDGNDKV